MEFTLAAHNMFDFNECTTNVFHSIDSFLLLALPMCRPFCAVGSLWENHHWQLFHACLPVGISLRDVSAFAC